MIQLLWEFPNLYLTMQAILAQQKWKNWPNYLRTTAITAYHPHWEVRACAPSTVACSRLWYVLMFARIEFTSLLEQMRNPVDLLNRFSPHIQSRILRSLRSPVTSERLHGMCVCVKSFFNLWVWFLWSIYRAVCTMFTLCHPSSMPHFINIASMSHYIRTLLACGL